MSRAERHGLPISARSRLSWRCSRPRRQDDTRSRCSRRRTRIVIHYPRAYCRAFVIERHEQGGEMNVRIMRPVGILVACLGLTSAAVADDSMEEQSARAAGHELLASRVAVGYRINPVELRLRGKNRFLVGLGSYLVNAGGGCNDCHTHPSFAPGGDPFKGETEIINTAQFLAGGRQFGPITSANITPDEHGRPAGLTFEEFAAA